MSNKINKPQQNTDDENMLDLKSIKGLKKLEEQNKSNEAKLSISGVKRQVNEGRVKKLLIRIIYFHFQVSFGPKDRDAQSFNSQQHKKLIRRRSEEDETETLNCSLGRLSRDDRLVVEMKIPLTVLEIIHKPMEEFNDFMTSKAVGEEQINICRDIRRRGKNKVRTNQNQ